MPDRTHTKDELLLEVADLRLRMAEAEDILRAIRDYEVDAVVVRAPQGDKVYALETADDAYRQMVEQMREGAATLSTDGIVLFANQPLAQLLNCPLEKLLGEPFAACLPPAEQPRLTALLQAPEGGRTTGFLQTQDGTRVPALFSASRMLLDEQPVVMVLITDLTYEKQADRVARLLRLATRLSVAVTHTQVAEAIVNGALQVFEADCGFVAVPTADGAQLRTLYVAGYSQERQRQIEVLPLELGQPVSDAIRQRALVMVETEEERRQRYPHWPPPQVDGAAGAILAVPLLLPDRLVGVLHIGFASARAFDSADRDFALTVAQQCAQALERASLYSQLEERVQARTADLQTANDQLGEANQHLSNEVAKRRRTQQQLERSREEERTRVARELHDQLGGALTVLKMDVSRVLHEESSPGGAQQKLADISRAIEGAVNMVRRLATELRPQLLDDFGLVPALQAHLQEFLKRSGLAGEFICPVDHLSLTSEAETACFRIVQEALTNVARHAQATHVTVSLEPDGDGVLLRVSDNGRGMRPEDRGATGHLGLLGMQERASLLSAPFEIISGPGQGTTVVLRIRSEAAQGT